MISVCTWARTYILHFGSLSGKHPIKGLYVGISEILGHAYMQGKIMGSSQKMDLPSMWFTTPRFIRILFINRQAHFLVEKR